MQTVIQKFFARVKITPTCWVWTAGTNAKNYGRFFDGKKNVAAHRFAFEITKGKIAPDHQIDHLCRNPLCVNPGHLEAVTARDNLMRGKTKAAENARKTHCRHGHPFSAENTYHTKNNRRLCRACAKKRNDATAEYRRNYYKMRYQH